ncbi:MAG: hypothetical protein AAFW75_07645 [Cyanobacteria bacterium J06636_16]
MSQVDDIPGAAIAVAYSTPIFGTMHLFLTVVITVGLAIMWEIAKSKKILARIVTLLIALAFIYILFQTARAIAENFS